MEKRYVRPPIPSPLQYASNVQSPYHRPTRDTCLTSLNPSPSPFPPPNPTNAQFLFFALFSIIGKTSSFIGPFVSSAIIERSGNTNMPFTFLLALGVFSVGILCCVNVEKSRVECRRYLEEEAVRVYGMGGMEKRVGSGEEVDGEGEGREGEGM